MCANPATEAARWISAATSASSGRASRTFIERLISLPGVESRAGGGAAPRVVRRARARPAVAADARPVRDPRLGSDAPADAGRARDPALPGVARALADGGGACGGVTRGRHPRVAGPRLQPARPEPPPSGEARGGARLAARSTGTAGRRAVHGGGRPP